MAIRLAIQALFALLLCLPFGRDARAANEDEFLRQQERARVQRSLLEHETPVHLEMPPGGDLRWETMAAETPCFSVRKVSVSSVDGRAAELLAVLEKAIRVSGAEGRCLGTGAVRLLVQHLQSVLIEQGWVTARLLVGAQNLSDGQLVLTLVPGWIREIHLQSADTGSLPPSMALAMQPGAQLNLRDIEQSLENLKRVPTADADIRIVPGNGPQARPGDSDLEISYRQAKRVRLNLSADDSGTQATGKRIGSATVSVDNPLGLSDLFYVSLNSDLVGEDGTQGTRGRSFHYSLPAGYWLATLSTSESSYYQTVAGQNQPYIYRGESSNLEFKLSRVVWRDARHKSTLGLRAFQRTSHNYVGDTELATQKRIVGGWEGFWGHNFTLESTRIDGNLAYRRGTGDFGTLPAPEEATGEGTAGFALLAGDLALSHAFSWLAQHFRYTASFRFQRHYTPLTPQDRFAIAGRYTVRGFDGEQLLSADSGWVLRNDLGLTLPGTRQELYLGMDGGGVSGPSSELLVGQHLAGVVIGLRGALGDACQYDVFGGRPLQVPEGFRTASFTTGFSLYLSF